MEGKEVASRQGNLERLMRLEMRKEVTKLRDDLQQDRDKMVRVDALVTALRTRVMTTEERCEVVAQDLEQFSIALQEVLRQQGSYSVEPKAKGTTHANEQEK